MKNIKVISTFLILLMIFTMTSEASFAQTMRNSMEQSVAVTTGNTTFSDIKGHWAESIINEAAAMNIVGGYPDGTFRPDLLIKREEFFKLLSNILTTKPDITQVNINFKDVDPNEWYVPTVKMVVAANLVQGYEDGTFGIGRMMSRQEAAKVAAAAIPAVSVDTTTPGVENVKDKDQIGDWAYGYVNIMFKKGYMKGDDKGNFRPTAAITRAEAATILLNIKKHEPVIAGNIDANNSAGTVVGTVVNDSTDIHKDKGRFLRGKGTESEPFEITTAEQLNHIRQHISEKAYYRLTNDIVLTSDLATTAPAFGSQEPNWEPGNFIPIGTEKEPFLGYFDGNRHTISGLNVDSLAKGNETADSTNKKAASYAGLFGYLGDSASVVSLTLSDSTFNGNLYVGSVAGYSKGTIQDCILNKGSTVKGNSHVGGIVGYSEKPLNSNVNKGNVIGWMNHVGGIVGSLTAKGDALTKCINMGTVTGNQNTGGVAGGVFPDNDSVVVKNCSNSGEVDGGEARAGGVIGMIDSGVNRVTVANCYNKGRVFGNGINGGVVGFAAGKRSLIENSYNVGTVNGGGSGGIIGGNEGTVRSSYNSGDVIANLNAGGIASFQNEDDAIILKCYNEGTVTAKTNAGGIIGDNRKRISNCYNAGKVKGTDVIGGIAGKNQGVIGNVYGAGKVSGNSAGSLAGRNAGTMTDGFWLDESCTKDIGIRDASAKEERVRIISEIELSGQRKIRTAKGYELITDVLNENNTVPGNSKTENMWEFDYRTVTGDADIDTANYSNNGNANDHTKGNVIHPTDLLNVYLYPRIIGI